MHGGLEVCERLELWHGLVVDGVPHKLTQRQLQVHHRLREHPAKETWRTIQEATQADGSAWQFCGKCLRRQPIIQ